MKNPLPAPSFAVNPIRASLLQSELAQEFSKRAWHSAYERALSRWKDEGHRPSRITTTSSRKRAFWID